jgi:hypothetical protein
MLLDSICCACQFCADAWNCSIVSEQTAAIGGELTAFACTAAGSILLAALHSVHVQAACCALTPNALM